MHERVIDDMQRHGKMVVRKVRGCEGARVRPKVRRSEGCDGCVRRCDGARGAKGGRMRLMRKLPLSAVMLVLALGVVSAQGQRTVSLVITNGIVVAVDGMNRVITSGA